MWFWLSLFELMYKSFEIPKPDGVLSFEEIKIAPELSKVIYPRSNAITSIMQINWITNKYYEAFFKKFFLLRSFILLYLWFISDMWALDFIAFSIFSVRIFRSLSSTIVRGFFFSLELKRLESDLKGFFMSQTNNIKEHGNREK